MIEIKIIFILIIIFILYYLNTDNENVKFKRNRIFNNEITYSN